MPLTPPARDAEAFDEAVLLDKRARILPPEGADAADRCFAIWGFIVAEPTVIYDFRANNGDDVDYCLLKADKVVAVEANPTLANLIRERFADAIATDRLVR